MKSEYAIERHVNWVNNKRRFLVRCFVVVLFRRRSKKTSKPRVTGICEGNSPVNYILYTFYQLALLALFVDLISTSVTGPLCGEFTGHRWIPLTNAGDAGLWCFLWSAPEQHNYETSYKKSAFVVHPVNMTFYCVFTLHWPNNLYIRTILSFVVFFKKLM